MIDQSIFKSYDVRGIYPEELNEEAGFVAASAFVRFTGAKNVVVGHDARNSSPALFKALVAGLLAQGVKVTSIGQTPTEGLYFAVANYQFDAGIMITASHNPKEYNGFKMIKKASGDIQWIRGKDLLPFVKEDIFKESDVIIPEFDIWPDYVTLMKSFFEADKIKPLKIVVDASNGVIGSVVEKIKSMLPVEIISLNFQPDGNFPNHSPNPLEKGSSDQIKEAIISHNADAGFMFDGDADRIFLVDQQGQVVAGDTTLLLLAKHFLGKHLGMGIAYTAICSRALPVFVKKWGGVPIRTAVGFVNVRQGLLDHNGVMGGEPSCHYCFKEYWYMDSGIIAFLTLLQIISQDPSTNGSGQARKVSEIIKELSPYAKAEANFEVKNKEAVLEKIKQTYVDGQQDFLDGITIEYSDWWFNVRPSNTEPLLRLTIEADSEKMLELKKKELSGFIGNK